MNLSEAFLEYIEMYVQPYQSIKTVWQFQYAQRSITAYGDPNLKDLDQDFIRKWQYSLLKRGLSPNTVRGNTEKLRKVLKYHYAKGNDCLSPDLVHSPAKVCTNPEWLTEREVNKVIKLALKPRERCSKLNQARLGAMIALLYSTGLRVSEMAKLDIKDIEQDTIPIIGKMSKHRLVFIDKRSRRLLNQYLNLREDDNPALFVSGKGYRLDTCKIRLQFRKLSKLYGKRIHPHTLRHSYATNLLGNGCHIYTLQRLMGHSNIVSTSVYLHVLDPELQEAYSKFHSC